eukprot:jgi/Astpho2/4901/Aster-05830
MQGLLGCAQQSPIASCLHQNFICHASQIQGGRRASAPGRQTCLIHRTAEHLLSSGRRVGSRRAAKLAATAVLTDSNPAGSERYDYIVIGGGTAGCVLGNRLTADGSKKVLILEAGVPNTSFDVKVPAALTRLFKSNLDWNLYSKRQEQLADRNIYVARGKLLGGSSSTNATLYHRGTAEDYDSWGVPGWGSKDALEWFLACEDNDLGARAGVHGIGGTMHVENPRYQNPLHDVFFQAAKEKGLTFNPDFNDWNTPQTGYGEFQVAQDRGERADMFRQYLKPAMNRSNLTVLTGAKTLKIETEQHSGKPAARAVKFSTKGPAGQIHTAELAEGGEVLLAAGAVHTPQILQLSGIGPKQALQEQGIPVVADVAGVGENLQDHPACLSSFIVNEESGPISVTDEIYGPSGRLRLKAVLNWLVRRRGPLTTTGCDHGAFVNTLGGKQADLQLRFVPASSLNNDGVSAYRDFADLKSSGVKWPTGFTFQIIAVRPESKGKIGLKSDDPWDSPAILPQYLTDKQGRDAATLRNGVKLSREMAGAPAFKQYVKEELWPGTGVQSDDQIDEYIRSSLHSANAVVGSCRMGQSASEGAVVDTELRVYGVRNLRIIDASVLPVIPGGQTGAATVMVAERGSALLTRDQAPAKAREIAAAVA